MKEGYFPPPKTFNVVCTIINLAILLFFIIFGAIYVVPGYWTAAATNTTIYLNVSGLCNASIVPEAARIPEPGGFAPFGIAGVLQASGILFFSFLGFDSVSTLAEEAAKPKRDLPAAILGSLVILKICFWCVY